MAETQVLHATTIAIDGRAVMLLGPSGAGKSDLALRLIDRGAILVSDDYTQLARSDTLLIARAPSTIAGKIEVRGLGIISLPHMDDVAVALAVSLRPAVDRMPERQTERFLDIPVRTLTLAPFPSSAPLVIEHALRHDLP